MCQPAKPLPIGARRHKAMGVSRTEIEQRKLEILKRGAALRAVRLSRDPLCPAARFDALKAALGDNFEQFGRIESGSLDNPRSAHSVFTADYGTAVARKIDRQFEQLVRFLQD